MRQRLEPDRLVGNLLDKAPGAAWFVMLFLAIFCAGTGMDARQASAAGGDILWQYDDAKPAKQEAFSSVADSAGNIIVVGSTQNGSEDFFTAKINQDGS